MVEEAEFVTFENISGEETGRGAGDQCASEGWARLERKRPTQFCKKKAPGSGSGTRGTHAPCATSDEDGDSAVVARCRRPFSKGRTASATVTSRSACSDARRAPHCRAAIDLRM